MREGGNLNVWITLIIDPTTCIRTHDSISDENGNFGWNFQSIVKGRVPVSGYSSCPASIKFRSKFKFSHYYVLVNLVTTPFLQL